MYSLMNLVLNSLYICVHLNIYLSTFLKNCIVHAHLPSDFVKTSLDLIIKSKTGDSSDKNSYRPIALVTAVSIVQAL